MIEKLDMEKLQKLVYYINNVKMSGPQREQVHRSVIVGILHGEIDTDDLFPSAGREESSISLFLESDAFLSAGVLPGWIQATRLYELYDGWCAANGMKPESLTAFGRELKDLGIQFKKKSDGNYYLLDSIVSVASSDGTSD